jgi:hypothetical protein
MFLVLLVTINVVPNLLILSTLMMAAKCTSETSVLTRPTRRHIPEDGSLRSHRRKDLKSYETVMTLSIMLGQTGVVTFAGTSGYIHFTFYLSLCIYTRQNVTCYNI